MSRDVDLSRLEQRVESVPESPMRRALVAEWLGEASAADGFAAVAALVRRPRGADALRLAVCELLADARPEGPGALSYDTRAALYSEARDAGFEVVGVTRSKHADADTDAEFEKARRYIEKREITFPIGFDDSGRVHGDYRVGGIPTTVLIDRDGRIVDYGVGLPGGRKLMTRARSLLDR